VAFTNRTAHGIWIGLPARVSDDKLGHPANPRGACRVEPACFALATWTALDALLGREARQNGADCVMSFTGGKWKHEPFDPLYVFGAGDPCNHELRIAPVSVVSHPMLRLHLLDQREKSRVFYMRP